MAAGSQQLRNDSKPSPRSGHVAVIDGDSMFIWGGFSEYVDPYIVHERYQQGTDVWVYHALVDRWYKKQTQGDAPPGTSGATAVILDNELYIVGGHTALGNTNLVFRLNLNQWKWTRADVDEENARKMSPRDKFTAWEYKNRIYVFGGFGVSISDFLSDHGDFYVDTSTYSPVRGWNNQVLIFDPQHGTWRNPAMQSRSPLPRAAHASVCFHNKVFIFGGRHNDIRLNDLHCLDLDKLQWSGELSVPGEMPAGRSWHSFTKVSDTHAVLYGGYTQEGSPLSDGWLLDSTVGQWTQLPLPTNQPRLWHTGVGSADGHVLIFGGCTNDILSTEEATNHTNEMLVVRCCVKSLLRLCLDVAYEHHEVLQKEWTSLPQSLCHILQLRLEGPGNGDEESLGHNTKACTIS